MNILKNIMNKRILNYSYQSARSLHSFYTNPDIIESAKYDTYDVIICNRDNVQDDFQGILKYSSDNTKILVDIVQESGNLDSFIDFFDNLTKTHSNIKFYLIVDSEFDFLFSSNVKSLLSYNLSFLAFFENFCIRPHDSQLILNQYSIEGELNIYDKEPGILSLNGSIRSHRVLLLLELIKRGYISKTGIISDNSNKISFLFYSQDSFDLIFYKSFLDGLINNGIISNEQYNFLHSLSNILPIKLHNEDGNRPNIEFNESYKKIINLITENTAGYDGTDNFKYKTITFTEKAWKPFKAHQLPLFISLPGYVKKIKSLGFDVYDDFINHSYDNETNHYKRLLMVLDELDRISKLDCIEFYQKNYNRFIKNYVNIYKLKSKAYLDLQRFIFDNDLI